MQKGEVTGAVAVVDSETIEILKPVKVEQALQGTVSGLMLPLNQVRQVRLLNIRIRGIATNGQNGPTTIIDVRRTRVVKSLMILSQSQDAQAAIYGTIGANG
jgi:hypothetical protein